MPITTKLHNTEIPNSIKDNNELTNIQKILLANRLKDNSDISEILYGSKHFVYDMLTMKDIKEAATSIASYINNNKRIAIVTDYDSDGINSAVVLTKSFKEIFKYDNIITIINKRIYGNGINSMLLSTLIEENNKNKIDMIITADHGSSDELNISKLRELGISIVLTDHHKIPEDNYPKSANYLINPERTDCDYNQQISGCSVAFLVMVATYIELRNDYNITLFNTLLPNVALSTISDVMPLDNPVNRHMVLTGLKEMNSLRNPVWVQLKKMYGINTLITTNDISYKIAPIINTANRTNNEELAFNLLMANDAATALEYIKKLDTLSNFRKAEQKRLYKDILVNVINYKYDNSIVAVLDSTMAINGILAGQLSETYNKPTVCFLDDGSNIITGSARGTTGNMDIVNVFNKINSEDSSIFVKFGGHKNAAGCAIYKDKIESFRELFDKYVAEEIIEDDILELNIDYVLPPSEITPSLIHEINVIGPYGNKWEQPVFMSRLRIGYVLALGNMLKITFRHKNRDFVGVFFSNKYSDINTDNYTNILTNGKLVDVVYNLELTNFNNSTYIQLRVLAIKDIE